MKIEIDIPEGDVGKSVVEILRELPPSTRRDLARQVMAEWLAKGLSDAERKVREAEVIQELRKDRYHSDRSDQELRSTYQFNQRMGEWKSIHDRLVEETVRAVGECLKEEVRKVVYDDPRMKALCHEVGELVKRNLPKAVHDAQVAWFTAHMGQILEGVARSSANLSSIEQFKEEMAEQIRNVGSRRV